jgi:hypothetical protein
VQNAQQDSEKCFEWVIAFRYSHCTRGNSKTFLESHFMSDFNRYVTRHGEIGLQALIEGMERREGLKVDDRTPLEIRWNALMQGSPVCQQPHRVAA